MTDRRTHQPIRRAEVDARTPVLRNCTGCLFWSGRHRADLRCSRRRSAASSASANSASTRSGLPAEWEWPTTGDILVERPLLAADVQFARDLAGLTVVLTAGVPRWPPSSSCMCDSSAPAFCFNYLLLGLMFPAATAILPLFIKIRDLGLLDTYWGVVLPQVAFGLAMSILLFRNYFRQLPSDLFDAALIDGCGYFRFFWHIILPLSRPILCDRGDDRLRPQLEQLPAAAGGLEPRDASTPGRSASWSTRASTRRTGKLMLAFITLTILPAIDHVLRRPEAHRGRADRRLGQGMKRAIERAPDRDGGSSVQQGTAALISSAKLMTARRTDSI